MSPLIDIEFVQDLARLDAAGGSFLPQFIAGFSADVRATLERLRACARAGEIAPLRSEAHRLKGSSASLGALALARECDEIGRCAHRDDAAGACTHIESALQALDATCDAILQVGASHAH